MVALLLDFLDVAGVLIRDGNRSERTFVVGQQNATVLDTPFAVHGEGGEPCQNGLGFQPRFVVHKARQLRDRSVQSGPAAGRVSGPREGARATTAWRHGGTVGAVGDAPSQTGNAVSRICRSVHEIRTPGEPAFLDNHSA